MLRWLKPPAPVQGSAAFIPGMASRRKSALTPSTESGSFPVAHNIATPKKPPVTNWTTASVGAERSSRRPIAFKIVSDEIHYDFVQ